MDRIDLYRIYLNLMDSSSFTLTAEALNMPRSSVSAALKELEARVGAQLLYRTTRKVSPTQDGILFYERCLRLVSYAEDTETMFRQSSKAPSGTLRINVPGRIGRLIIVPALPEFLRLYPEMDIDIGITDRAVNIIEESIDCVLRVGEINDSSLIVKPMGELRLINAASPDYIKNYGVPKTPDDLKSHLKVNYSSSISGKIMPWEWVENGIENSIDMKSRVIVNNAETYIAACISGMGIIQIPAYDIKKHIENGELIEIMPEYHAAPMPMSLIYARRHHFTRRIKVFADWLYEILHKAI